MNLRDAYRGALTCLGGLMGDSEINRWKCQSDFQVWGLGTAVGDGMVYLDRWGTVERGYFFLAGRTKSVGLGLILETIDQCLTGNYRLEMQ